MKTMIFRLFFILSFLGCCWNFCPFLDESNQPINKVINDFGGYKNILVSIDPDTAQDINLLENIKDYFTRASKELYKATGNRFYFEEISILIPYHWNFFNSKQATTQTFENGHFRVGPTTTEWGDKPFTIRMGGKCGNPGVYTYLTHQFFNQTSRIEKQFGRIDKLLVREWGQLRWGLPDESNWAFGRPDCLQSYDKEEIQINRYPNNLEGDLKKGSESCSFYPKYDPQNSPSMMYAHYLENSKFPWEGSSERYYNPNFLNEENRLCNGMNSWDIMSNHPDLQKPIVQVNNVEPTFTIYKQTPLRIALLLDLSDGNYNPPALSSYYYEDIHKFLNSPGLRNAYVGLAGFRSSAEILHDMIKVQSNEDVQKLLDRVLYPENVTQAGDSAMGSGLLKAVELLSRSSSGFGTKGGIIIVVKAVAESPRSTITKAVVDQIIDSGVRVYSLIKDNDFHLDLLKLSYCSGGVPYTYTSQYVPMNQGYNSADSIMQILADNLQKDQVAPFLIAAGAVNIREFRKSTVEFYVNEHMSKNIVFTFYSVKCQKTRVHLRNPDDETIFNLELSMIYDSFTVYGGRGRWILDMYGGARKNCTVRYTVQTYQRANDPNMIFIDGWMTKTYLQKTQNGDLDRLTIQAKLRQGDKPIINAYVESVRQYESGGISRMQLYDDGAGEDLVKDDGIYTGTFGRLTHSPGTMFVRAKNKNEETRILNINRSFSKSNLAYHEPIQEERSLSKIEDFELVKPIGGAYVNFTTSGYYADHYPPSKINDLKILSISCDMTVELKWSSPGEQMEFDRAWKYIIYYSRNSSDIRNNCTESCKRVDPNMFVPSYGYNFYVKRSRGGIESSKINFKKVGFELGDEIFISIQTMSRKKTSELSNVVSTRFIYDISRKRCLTKGHIIGIAVAGGIIALLIATVIILLIVKKKKKGNYNKNLITSTISLPGPKKT